MNATFTPFEINVGLEHLHIDSESKLSRTITELYEKYRTSESAHSTALLNLGQALNQIRDRYPTGTWELFLSRHKVHAHTARRAMALAHGTPHKRNTPANTGVRSLSESVSESVRIPQTIAEVEAVETSGHCVMCGDNIQAGVVCERCKEEHETDDVSEVPSVDMHDFGSEPQPVYTTEARSAYLRASFTSEPAASGLVDSERRSVVNHAAADGSKAGAANSTLTRPTQMTFDSLWSAAEGKIAAAKAAMNGMSDAGRNCIETATRQAMAIIDAAMIKAAAIESEAF